MLLRRQKCVPSDVRFWWCQCGSCDSSCCLVFRQLWRNQCSTLQYFRTVCDVPSIAVFCSEQIKCFPDIAQKYFKKGFYYCDGPTVTGKITHLRFHIRCIFVHKPFYFFPLVCFASFCVTFLSAGVAISISMHVFSFLLLIIYLAYVP